MSGEVVPQNVTIRPAMASDYDAIVNVWRESGSNVRTSGRERREAFEQQLAAFSDLYLVAEWGGRMVGVVLGSHDHRKGWINRLAVRPEWRRHGVATSLVDACDAAIRARGIEIVCALVEAGNEPSARLFESMGYDQAPVRYFRKLSRPNV